MRKRTTWPERLQHVELQLKEGLSINEYCRRNRLHPTTFSNWIREYKESKPSESSVTSDFIEVHNKSNPAGESIVLEFPSGLRLSSPIWPPVEVLLSYAAVKL